VSSWVGTRIAYVTGSSLPTDGAVRTLLSRRGVCRDFAHLVVAFLRALDVPARVVGVYAPGLSPMDFHAVAEAAIDGVWHVVDATTLAPRQSLVRIATGRDAADIAFLSARGDRSARDDRRPAGARRGRRAAARRRPRPGRAALTRHRAEPGSPHISRAYGRGMILPPLTTRRLQSAIEAKRRADADLRWRQSFRPARPSISRRDIPVARSSRG